VELLTSAAGASLRFWYGGAVSDFLTADPDSILGELARNCQFALMPTQRDAWRMQVEFLRQELAGLQGSIFLEFNIPRMGRRIDAVLVIGPVVFAVEFKVGESTLDRAAVEQVWDYALDLKNFHKARSSRCNRCLSSLRLKQRKARRSHCILTRTKSIGRFSQRPLRFVLPSMLR
jgi:hypothetical protein